MEIFFRTLYSITFSKLSSNNFPENSSVSIFLLDFKKDIILALFASLQFIILRIILFQFSVTGFGKEAPEKSKFTSLSKGKFKDTCK